MVPAPAAGEVHGMMPTVHVTGARDSARAVDLQAHAERGSSLATRPAADRAAMTFIAELRALDGRVIRDAPTQQPMPVHGKDCMRTAEAHKLHWTSEVRAYLSLLLFAPGTAHGLAQRRWLVARPSRHDRAPRIPSMVDRLRGAA